MNLSQRRNNMYKALIVDDENIILNGLTNVIDWKKLRVDTCFTASNGIEALSIIDNQKINIMITDIKMPKMDGLELIKNVRELGYNDIQIIINTSYGEFEYAKEALKYSVKDYILKPSDLEDIENIIEKCINSLDEETENSDLEFIGKHKRLCENIIEYLEQNYNKEHTLDSLGKQFFLSPNYLSKIMKDTIGKSYKDVLMEIRIDKAKIMLKTGDYKTSEIAEKVGFKHYEHFRKIFKTMVGVNPTEY